MSSKSPTDSTTSSTTNGRTLVSSSADQGIDAMRLAEYTETATIGDAQAYRDATQALTKVVKDHRLAGLGDHGQVVGVEMEVDISLLAPDPLHPRDDWQDRDEAMELLIASQQKQGQLTPIYVTALYPDDPLALQGFAYIMIDGYRNYKSILLARRTKRVRIICYRDSEGRPLDAFDRLRYYMTQSLTQKPLKPAQVIRGFLALKTVYEASEPDGEMADFNIPGIMANFGIGEKTAQQVHYVLSNSLSLAEAVANRQLPINTAYALIQHTREQHNGAELIRQVLAVAERRIAAHESMLTQREALALVEQTTTALPSGLQRQTAYTRQLRNALLGVIGLYREARDPASLPEPFPELWPLLRDIATFEEELIG